MSKDRRKRPWIKQRLSESADAVFAFRIWERWKAGREAARNVARAIRIYDALLKGDGAAFHKLMIEFFPVYGLSLGRPRTEVDLDETRPAPAVRANNHRPKPRAAEILITSEAHNAETDEEDEFGFGHLEMG